MTKSLSLMSTTGTEPLTGSEEWSAEALRDGILTTITLPMIVETRRLSGPTDATLKASPSL